MVEANAHLLEFALGGRRVVAGVPPHHIYDCCSACWSRCIGGSALRNTPLSRDWPRPWSSTAQTSWCGAAAAHRAGRRHELLLPELRRVFCSAGPLKQQAASRLHARRVTGDLAPPRPGNRLRERHDAVWSPLRAVTVTIAADEVLCVDAPWLPPGLPRPLRTADRAEAAGQGFRHLGREDAVTKVAGRRVDLGDVESCLRAVPGVLDARVLAVDGKECADSLVGRRRVPADLAPSCQGGTVEPLRSRHRASATAACAVYRATRAARSRGLRCWRFRHVGAGFRIASGRRRQDQGATQLRLLSWHFTGDPILPGVVQLRHVALAETRRRFPELHTLARVTRVKFSAWCCPARR